jgi:hypothetical protein
MDGSDRVLLGDPWGILSRALGFTPHFDFLLGLLVS